jgi:hypothetical protein
MAELEKNEHWADLYRQALFEEDNNKLPQMLERAHQAVQQRAHELWCEPAGQQATSKERRELDAALYFLGLLRKMEQEGSIQERSAGTRRLA